MSERERCERCERCDRPKATIADHWDGSGTDGLCWAHVCGALVAACDPVDWRARCLAAEAANAKSDAATWHDAFEMAATVCEMMIVGGHAWSDEQAAAAEVLQAAAANIRALPIPTDPEAK